MLCVLRSSRYDTYLFTLLNRMRKRFWELGGTAMGNAIGIDKPKLNSTLVESYDKQDKGDERSGDTSASIKRSCLRLTWPHP